MDNGIICSWIKTMDKRDIKSWLTVALMLISIGLLSCSHGIYGAVVIKTHYVPPQKMSSIKPLSLPAGSDTVILSITGTDFKPIVQEVSVATHPSGVTIRGIPCGQERTVSIEVQDASHRSIAKGKTAGIAIHAGSTSNVDILITQVGLFTQLNARVLPRAFAVSSPLPDGRYIIMGGMTDRQSLCGSGCVQLAATQDTEIYDPSTGTFLPGPRMSEPRVFFTANELPDGSVAVIGGTDAVQMSCTVTACSISLPRDRIKTSIEVFDPVSSSFYKAQALSVPRAGHTANLLSGNGLLIAGGISSYGPAASAELLDIKTGKVVLYSMSFTRVFQTAFAFQDNALFLAGGTYENDQTEFFQPSGFTPSGTITCSAYFPSSVFMEISKIAVLNGGLDAYQQPVSRLMIIDLENRAVLSYHTMPFPRALFSDSILGDGNVLIAGGITNSVFAVSDAAEVFNPQSKMFVKYLSLSTQRAGYAAQSLQDGSALIVSGFSNLNALTGPITFADTAELYNP